MRSGLATSPTIRGLRAVSRTAGGGMPGHQRDVGGLEAAVGEIDRGRRLRGAADADQDHVGLLEVVRQLPVVVQQGEVHGVDALEILRVEHVLRARPRGRGRAEIGLEQGDARARAPRGGASSWRGRPPRALRQVRLDEGVEHDARRGLDLATARARAGWPSAPADRRARSPRSPSYCAAAARATVIRVSPVESETRWRWK